MSVRKENREGWKVRKEKKRIKKDKTKEMERNTKGKVNVRNENREG